MNILRQPPFPLEVSYNGLEASTDYIIEIFDDHNFSVVSATVTTDGAGELTYQLPDDFSKYDETYSLYVYTIDLNDNPDETVIIDSLYIYRPYVNPIDLSDSSCENEYINLERTARQIIDTLVGGFYYSRSEVETTGLGADFLPLPKRANRINQVYENNIKVYDRLDPIDGQYTYILSPDKTALTIQVDSPESYNRMQSKPVHLPVAASDSFMLYGDDYDAVLALTEIKGSAMFPKDWDYTIYGEWGWPVVPQDIKDATRMLIGKIGVLFLYFVTKEGSIAFIVSQRYPLTAKGATPNCERLILF